MPSNDSIAIPLWVFILGILILSFLFTGFLYFFYITDPVLIYFLIEDVISNPLPLIGTFILIGVLAELVRVVWRAWIESNVIELEDKDVASRSPPSENAQRTDKMDNETDEKAETETDVFLEKYRIKEPQKIKIPTVNVDEK